MDRVAQLEVENAVLVRRIAVLESENTVQAARIVELDELVSILFAKITVLEKLLKGDSSNSSRPPSSDPNTAKNKRPIANSRTLNKNAKRAQGKQPGAPGTTLRAVPNPDETVVHIPTVCHGCGDSLDDADIVGVSARQVFDIPTPHVNVVEHQAQRRRCTCGCETSATFPAAATAPACYGPNVKAYAIYLLCRQHIPQERCTEALAEMFEVDVCVGTLNNWLTDAADALAGFTAAVGVALGQAPVVHVDETSVRQGKGKAWFHVCSTRLLTMLWATKTRGLIAIRQGPLPTYTGTAIHDRYAAYFTYTNCGHGLCNAHLIRNLAGVGQVRTQKAWTDAMILLLTDTKTIVETAKTAGATALTDTDLAEIRDRWDLLCVQAHAANPEPSPGRTRTTYDRDSHNLAIAVTVHRDLFLKFTTNFDANFDNNQAERDLRMVKLQAKISGEFRSLHGAQRFATIRAYISTTIKHGLNVLDNLANIYTTNGPWLPPPAPT